MSDSNIDQQFVEYVVKSIVGHPDEVVVERTIDEKGVLLKLNVNPEDLGRVIGKRGVTAQSIRTLLRALGTKNDARYNFKIMDDGEEGKPERRREESRDDKPADEPTSDDSNDAADEEVQEGAQDEVKEEAKEEATEEVKKEVVEEVEEVEEEEQSLVDKTREELAEFDDLDI